MGEAGLTGFAQVSGLRGDTSIADRARYDNFYIENWSLWLDINQNHPEDISRGSSPQGMLSVLRSTRYSVDQSFPTHERRFLRKDALENSATENATVARSVEYSMPALHR